MAFDDDGLGVAGGAAPAMASKVALGATHAGAFDAVEPAGVGAGTATGA